MAHIPPSSQQEALILLLDTETKGKSAFITSGGNKYIQYECSDGVIFLDHDLRVTKTSVAEESGLDGRSFAISRVVMSLEKVGFPVSVVTNDAHQRCWKIG